MEEEILYSVKVEGVVSIENLTKANKALREERKSLDLQTAEGQKRVQDINKALDKNTETIKQNVSALEKQKINIGNYKSALDGVVPGFGKLSQGIEGTTTAAKAFIATPLGLVLGALGLAFGALMSYIKGSDEAGDRFAKTTATLGFVFEKLKIIVEEVGGFIFDTIEMIAGGVEKVIGFISPAAGEAIAQAKKAGEALAAIQDDIENRENDFLVKRADINAKVQALREKAIKQEGDAKRASIQEAIDLEKGLAKEETALSQSRLDAFMMENKARIEAGKLTSEQLKEQRTLEADIINQQSAGAQATIKFQKELERLNEESIKKAQEQREIDAANKRAQSETANFEEITTQQIHDEQMLQLNTDFNTKLNQDKDIANRYALKNKQATDKLIVESEKAKESQLQSLQNQAFALGVQLAGRNKTLQSGLTLISTYFSAQKAFESQFLPIPTAGSPVRGAIAAGIAIASGLARVLAINQVNGFANGGLTGTRIMSHHGSPINRSNGDNRLATVRTGEVILNERQQAALGGARTFANIGVPGFASGGFVSSTARASESSINFNQMMQAFTQVPIVVTVEDINVGQTRVGNIVNRARVI